MLEENERRFLAAKASHRKNDHRHLLNTTQHNINNKIKSSNIGRFIQVFTESNHWINMVQTKEGRRQTTVIYTLKDKNN